MTCTWCDKTAVSGGKIPRNFQGPEYLAACADHAYLIDKLHYDPMSAAEIETAERRKRIEEKTK